MFRVGGNIYLDNSEIVKGQTFRVSIGPKSNCISFIQYLKPLTKENPCFTAKLTNIKPESIATIGLASLDINEATHTGSWNNTIGYESQTGRCTCSHKINANTVGKALNKDDTFGLVVTYFGKNHSIVVFLHNNEPIATRYHFETDYEKYLPTITFENGPIECDVLWPDAVVDLPQISHKNLVTWIKPNGCNFNLKENYFENLNKIDDMPLQSPVALSKSFPHYKCTQLEVSNDGQGSAVGIASCSPLKPTPTCSLLRDYYTWLPKMKLKNGSSIGWGIFYNPNTPEIDDKSEQLALVYVTFNSQIVDVLFVLQPEGGFFPLVLMQSWSTKVKLEYDLTINDDDKAKLIKLFNSKHKPALDIYNADLNQSRKHSATAITLPLNGCLFLLDVAATDIETSSELVNIKIDKHKTVIKIDSSNAPAIHYIQYKKALTPERRFFFIEINKLGRKSNVVLGIASSIQMLNNKLPGVVAETVGYHSDSGYLHYNGKSQGNMMGKKYGRGDAVGLEMEVFEKDMSVALFSKNFRPVGTRFLTAKNFDEFYPTIAVETNGEPVEIFVYWQNKISMPPHFNVRNPEDWCYPEGTKIDLKEKIFHLPHHYDHSLCIQAPYSLHHKYNHFEILLIDDFDKNNPPPALALCTACPFDPPPVSQFKQDYLRFWPHGDAMSAVKKNDRLGWGIFYPDENAAQDEEQLVICYLTINRQVSYLRVLFQPPGGFYPVVIAPPNIYRIKLDFMATRVSTQDFTGEQVKQIIEDARKQIENEQKLIAQGINPREDDKNDAKRSKTCTIL